MHTCSLTTTSCSSTTVPESLEAKGEVFIGILGGGPNRTKYVYGEDNRLREAGQADFTYDHLGRRVSSSHSGSLGPSLSQVMEYWSYGPAGEMLSWVYKNTVPGGNGEEKREDYVYLSGERIAKIVTITRFAELSGGGGGGGGGGSCCAASAIADDGTGRCSLAMVRTMAILRGFRGQVLSGRPLGESLIRFYYRGLSPVVVAVLREYPEFRGALGYVLRGTAWMLSLWVTPAYAAPVPISTETKVYWYHNGLLGEPIALTDANAAVVRHVERAPFGDRESVFVQQIDDRFLFPGQFMDQQSGLVYNWNRWYAPEIGRYVEVDPLLGNGKGHLNMKRLAIAPLIGNRSLAVPEAYTYVFGNPLRLIDVDGLEASNAFIFEVEVDGGVQTWAASCYCSDPKACKAIVTAARLTTGAIVAEGSCLDCNGKKADEASCSAYKICANCYVGR